MDHSRINPLFTFTEKATVGGNTIFTNPSLSMSIMGTKLVNEDSLETVFGLNGLRIMIQTDYLLVTKTGRIELLQEVSKHPQGLQLILNPLSTDPNQSIQVGCIKQGTGNIKSIISFAELILILDGKNLDISDEEQYFIDKWPWGKGEGDVSPGPFYHIYEMTGKAMSVVKNNSLTKEIIKPEQAYIDDTLHDIAHHTARLIEECTTIINKNL